MSEETIKILRYMEWERAKGSLRAIMASYTDTLAADGKLRATEVLAEEFDNWKRLDDIVEKFIKDFGEKAGLD